MSRADQFAPLEPELQARWDRFGHWERTYYPTLLGLVVEEVRHGYSRMRLPHRPELEQPMGIVHGGAIASLIDSVVVPAVGSAYGPEQGYTTVDMHVQYLSALVAEDAVEACCTASFAARGGALGEQCRHDVGGGGFGCVRTAAMHTSSIENRHGAVLHGFGR